MPTKEEETPDFWYDDEIKCPHCGTSRDVDDDKHDNSWVEMCRECKRDYRVRVNVEWVWGTTDAN